MSAESLAKIDCKSMLRYQTSIIDLCRLLNTFTLSQKYLFLLNYHFKLSVNIKTCLFCNNYYQHFANTCWYQIKSTKIRILLFKFTILNSIWNKGTHVFYSCKALVPWSKFGYTVYSRSFLVSWIFKYFGLWRLWRHYFFWNMHLVY